MQPDGEEFSCLRDVGHLDATTKTQESIQHAIAGSSLDHVSAQLLYHPLLGIGPEGRKTAIAGWKRRPEHVHMCYWANLRVTNKVQIGELSSIIVADL